LDFGEKNWKEGNHVEDLGVGRRDDNIKIDLKEIRYEVHLSWIGTIGDML
jgi:hypothetical protein